MSGRDIFISYSSEDRTAARYFAECFEKEGLSVWWDAALRSGETFDEVIEAELKAAKAVVVLWSPRSVASRWVRAEVTIADRRHKLAPITIEPCDRPIIFELTHTTDLSNWTGETSDPAWQTVLRDVRRLVERADAAAASITPGRSERARQPAMAVSERWSSQASHVPEHARHSTFAGGSAPARMPSPGPVARHAELAPAVDDFEEQATQICHRMENLQLFVAEEYHCLEIAAGDKAIQRYVVSPLGLKIGRSAPADVILSDSRVSRTHCLVELANDRLRVSDLNSTNGTFIDGERIEGTAYLAVRSTLKIGSVSFTHVVCSRAEV